MPPWDMRCCHLASELPPGRPLAPIICPLDPKPKRKQHAPTCGRLPLLSASPVRAASLAAAQPASATAVQGVGRREHRDKRHLRHLQHQPPATSAATALAAPAAAAGLGAAVFVAQRPQAGQPGGQGFELGVVRVAAAPAAVVPCLRGCARTCRGIGELTGAASLPGISFGAGRALPTRGGGPRTAAVASTWPAACSGDARPPRGLTVRTTITVAAPRAAAAARPASSLAMRASQPCRRPRFSSRSRSSRLMVTAAVFEA
jgi:hypothetical protein